MKMKEVMQLTGLTRKTVWFYEENGLIAPSKTRQNGRDYRDYSQEDIQLLLDIAALRKAGFSIDEIKRMQNTPKEVRPIFSEYRHRLMGQKAELEELLHAVDAISLEELDTVQDLLRGIREASAPLPLPATDCTPHFRYIDDEEENLAPPPKSPPFHTDRRPIEIDQDHLFVSSQLGYKKALDDIKADFQDTPRSIAPNDSDGPLPLRIIKGITIILLVLFVLIGICVAGPGSPLFLYNLIIIVFLSVLLGVISLILKKYR